MSYRELSYEEREKIIQELDKLTSGDDRGDAYKKLKDDVDMLIEKFGLFSVRAAGNPAHNDVVILGFNITKLDRFETAELGMKLANDYGPDTIEIVDKRANQRTLHMFIKMWFD